MRLQDRRVRMMGHAIAGSSLVSLLIAAPVTFAQTQTTGATGTVTATVPAGPPPAGQPAPTLISVTVTPPPSTGTGGTTTPSAPVTVSISLPAGLPGGVTGVASFVPQDTTAFLSGVAGANTSGLTSSSQSFAVKLQTTAGQPIANVSVTATLSTATSFTEASKPQVFQIVMVNGQRVLRQIPPADVKVVNGKLVVTGFTGDNGELDLVLGATLSAPTLPTETLTTAAPVTNVAIPAAPVTSSVVTTTGVAASPISAGAIGGASLAVPAGLLRTGQGQQGSTSTLPLVVVGLGAAAGLAGVSFRRMSRKTS